MADKKQFTSSRKLDHLRICAEKEVESGDAGLADIRFVHNALPECDMGKIDLKCRFLNHTFSSPLYISGMTGGHPGTKETNARLARAAERYGIGMGVGSQRAALENPSLSDTFSVVRDQAPHAFLVANLGVVQLRDHGAEWAERAVEMIDADAIAIHLNFLQEAIQPEGDHDATGCLAAIEGLCRDFRKPVIVKETGCGISAGAARKLWGAGVKAIDIGGWGGTSWAAVESVRADESKKAGDRKLRSLGQDFASWGIPTIVSLAEVLATGGPVIASGGIRSGLDIAKGLAFGADLCGMALPLLKPAMTGDKALADAIDTIHRELTVAMFLTGSARVPDLRKASLHITGKTRQMIDKDNPARIKR
ncbi:MULTISPECIES: type 2 isopentenyl-diphosphate Delta-isomerase [unclassified Methanoregula]|uniref:type 2 isopentenyl-diphosphate Delta-isomerase n=1 Tax=unclassified Methanoregula TaxID=2649730 RepID=UPI0009D26331|nr:MULTISPECIES: type 2 isopentenyl-diphosphate Delta-isomerase [unclassified Methanoregula]OPX64033.1 MAG: Isopentenyl-diphosphate delta-isomerase [Methanoregula sp. PtaB.Bin085]OPY33769.1 MAG: Isopentenyl-diphosphate delta-isomerase [Methanoregula sp. PtaU1.Bin006]